MRKMWLFEDFKTSHIRAAILEYLVSFQEFYNH